VISVVSLLLGVVQRGKAKVPELPERVVLLLQRLVLLSANCTKEYMYHKTPCPWLQVKLLRLLQYFPMPSRNSDKVRLNEVLTRILSRSPDISKSVNKNNSDHSVLFEAINLIVHYRGDIDEKLKMKASALLGRYIQIRDSNMRYLGLSVMARLAMLDGTGEYVKKHQATILYGLKDPDISIRKRALNLLFLMCDKSNSLIVVKELLEHLKTADISIREEMVLKIAILAERYAPDYKWYVDTVLYIIKNSGAFIDDDIWQRACQIVSANADLQGYAARTVFAALGEPHVNEMLLRVAGYILGEYGDLLEEGPKPVTAEEQYALLRKHWTSSTARTQAILMGAFLKLGFMSPKVEKDVKALLARHMGCLDLELQQRAVEYSAILGGKVMSEDDMESILDKMPAFKMDKVSNLSKLVDEKDRAEWPRSTATSASAAASEESGGAAVAGGDAEEREEPMSEQSGSGGSGNQTLGDAFDSSADLMEDLSEKTFEASEAPQMRSWFVGLLSSSKARGKLYENETIQVGMGLIFNGCQGRLQVFFGNKTKETLEGFKVEYQQITELQWKVEPVKAVLDPLAQQRQRVQVICMKPFSQSPSITVSFQHKGTRHSYPLKMPVAVISFINGKAMASNQFMGVWNSLTAAGQSEQQTFVASPGSSLATITNAVTAADKLGFGQVAGIDNERSLTCAGLFETNSMGASGPIKVGCMLRIEGNQQGTHYRVTVRSAAPVLTNAILKLLVNLLK